MAAESNRRVGQNMDLAVAPGHDLAVHPERSISLVKRDHLSHENLGNPAFIGRKRLSL